MAFDVVIFSLSFLVLYIVCDLLQLPYELNMMFLSYFFLIFPFLCFLLHWIFSISVLNSVMLWVPFRFKLHSASPVLPYASLLKLFIYRLFSLAHSSFVATFS
jgi:hypothetical protein